MHNLLSFQWFSIKQATPDQKTYTFCISIFTSLSTISCSFELLVFFLIVKVWDQHGTGYFLCLEMAIFYFYFFSNVDERESFLFVTVFVCCFSAFWCLNNFLKSAKRIERINLSLTSLSLLEFSGASNNESFSINSRSCLQWNRIASRKRNGDFMTVEWRIVFSSVLYSILPVLLASLVWFDQRPASESK